MESLISTCNTRLYLSIFSLRKPKYILYLILFGIKFSYSFGIYLIITPKDSIFFIVLSDNFATKITKSQFSNPIASKERKKGWTIPQS